MKKWIVLLAGMCLQTVLGSVYGWSAFVPSLTRDYGLGMGQTGFIFGITIAVFTITMIPAGKLIPKYGPRPVASVGALLYMAGYILASTSNGNYVMILIGIGIITGAGIGAGYVCPLTTGMKWFPDNKGLVIGVSVAGFGGGAVIMSHLVRYLLIHCEYNVLQTFRLVGLGLGSIAIASSLLLDEPKNNRKRIEGSKKTQNITSHICSKPFLLLCTGMFSGTFAGLLIIGNLKPILLGLGLDIHSATLGISFFAAGNVLGRIIWGQIHDRLGIRYTILLSLACMAISSLLLVLKMSAVLLFAAVIIIGISFGACFVVYASTIVKHYGMELFASLYPICFLAYGLAGVLGPTIGGKLADITGAFHSGIMLSTFLVCGAFVLNAIGLHLAQTPETKHVCLAASKE